MRARAVELMVPGGFFSSLMMLCYCFVHTLKHFVQWNWCIEEMRSLLDLLEFEGYLARKLRFHLFNSWNSKETSHESFVFINFHPLKGLFNSWNSKETSHESFVFINFHLFNSWNSKDTSHESFVFTSSTPGIRRKPRTKASFSHLQLLEFEGSLARTFSVCMCLPIALAWLRQGSSQCSSKCNTIAF